MAACTYIFRLRAATLPRWPSSSTKCPCEVVKGRGVSSSALMASTRLDPAPASAIGTGTWAYGQNKRPYQPAPGQSVGAGDRVAPDPWWHGQPWPGKDQGALAMHRSPSLPSAAAIPAPDVPREMLTRGPPPGSGRASVGSGAAEVIRYLTEDHDRIAQRMNDVVVRRIFAAGLDLQVALGLIGDHSGAGKIYHALDELDQAIRDIRDTIFDRSPPVHHASLIKTHDGPPCTPTLARAVLMDSR